MKATGVIRKVDNLGRIVIPKELRSSLQLDTGTPMEVFVDEDYILLRKYEISKACFVTGEISEDNVKIGEGKYISEKGLEYLNKKFQHESSKEE